VEEIQDEVKVVEEKKPEPKKAEAPKKKAWKRPPK